MLLKTRQEKHIRVRLKLKNSTPIFVFRRNVFMTTTYVSGAVGDNDVYSDFPHPLVSKYFWLIGIVFWRS